ncbi:MAG: bifunctional oligoribonuclease/PAP phosphatase NrnA [Bacteroidota bacterium]
MTETAVATLKDLLSSPKRIAITTHQKPDGDALGSSLAWYHYLKKGQHKVKIVTPTDYPDFLKWLPGNDDVLIGPVDPDMANWTFEGADLIFCLDFNAIKRINEFESVVMDAEGMKIMIDHHLEPEGFEDLGFLDATASSTAELVYRLIVELGDKELVDKEIADALYVGVMTDTGSFRFTNTSPAVHRMVAHLMEMGVDVHQAHDRIYSNSSPDRVRFIGHVLSNCLTILPELNTSYIKLEREVFKKFNVKSGDTEGLVQYALGIKGINLGILMAPQDNIVKLSFRSRNEVSSADLAKEFGGGGHFYAAGGRSQGNLEETEQRLIELLEKRKLELAGPAG